MDPAIFAHLTETSPLVGILLVALWHFHKRDARNDRRAEERHKSCEDRNRDLGTRIETLEDLLVGKYADLAERSIRGLAESTSVLKRAMNDPVTPPMPMRAHVDHH